MRGSSKNSHLITRSLAQLIENGVIFVDRVHSYMLDGTYLLNCLGMVTQRKQKC